jgi:hypothetical protein
MKSGPRYFQPDPEHIRRLLRTMDAGSTPVFFKGNIRPSIAAGLGSPELDRWREDFPRPLPRRLADPRRRRQAAGLRAARLAAERRITSARLIRARRTPAVFQIHKLLC